MTAEPKPFIPPDPSKQLQVHELLLGFRSSILHDALKATLTQVDPDRVAAEMAELAPQAGRQILAGAGIRDEDVFMVPTVIIANPRLVGYYRLVLGVPQKQLYASATGMGTVKKMEDKGVIPPTLINRIPDLCRAMNESMSTLVDKIKPTISKEDLQQRPLLVLGVQIDGILRNKIGAHATAGVFDAMREVIEGKGISTEQSNDGRQLSLTNASGRTVTIKFASDPDVVIEEDYEGENHFKVAIEIKGGMDGSNAHNRAGEAEKSHQKVSGEAGDFWTVISLQGIDLDTIKNESPTTKHWFDVSEVLARQGASWDQFKTRTIIACGI